MTIINPKSKNFDLTKSGSEVILKVQGSSPEIAEKIYNLLEYWIVEMARFDFEADCKEDKDS